VAAVPTGWAVVLLLRGSEATRQPTVLFSILGNRMGRAAKWRGNGSSFGGVRHSILVLEEVDNAFVIVVPILVSILGLTLADL
jgi:hypothetical protein